MTHHPDAFRLISALDEYDRVQGAMPDAEGRVAGVDSFSLLGTAASRAEQMFENFGPLRKTLTPAQTDEVKQLMTAMWQDGFSARATYERLWAEG